MKNWTIQYAFFGIIALTMIVAGCQKHTYDFTYSPNNPKIGQKVVFTNTSDAGESWVWKFGDGNQSTIKNPTHVYANVGTYVVELMVDSNKSRKIQHVLEVVDSLPSIYLYSDTAPQYALVTMKVALYNPKNSKVSCLWEVDESIFSLVEGDYTSDSIVGYYTDYGRTTNVGLTITVGSKTTTDQRTITLIDNPAPSLLMLTLTGDMWRQRIYEGMYEYAKHHRGAEQLIEAANDSTAELNGVIYDIHNMPVLTDKDVLALQVDAINRKLYVILDDGLYVANANGEYLTRIWDEPCGTLLVDAERNSIYWSDLQGVWAMQLVTHPQNIISETQFSRIQSVNDVPAVCRMTIID